MEGPYKSHFAYIEILKKEINKSFIEICEKSDKQAKHNKRTTKIKPSKLVEINKL